MKVTPRARARGRRKPKLPTLHSDWKPKPFSAHFHAEGDTLDELHRNLKKVVGPHLKDAAKKRKRSKPSAHKASKALSS